MSLAPAEVPGDKDAGYVGPAGVEVAIGLGDVEVDTNALAALVNNGMRLVRSGK